MSKDRTIDLNEGSMSCHAKIGLHIFRWLSPGINQAKAKTVGRAYGNSGWTIPDHRVAVGKFERRAEFALTKRLRVRRSIFQAERSALHLR